MIQLMRKTTNSAIPLDGGVEQQSATDATELSDRKHSSERLLVFVFVLLVFVSVYSFSLYSFSIFRFTRFRFIYFSRFRYELYIVDETY